MSHRYPDFNESGVPLAYFISFRCYGTWLHGDERGSVDHLHNIYGSPKLPADKNMWNGMLARMKNNPSELGAQRRKAVEEGIKETCNIRSWTLRAINVRTNHVHTVVTADKKPELVLNAFKANATSKMIAASVWQSGVKPWSRHAAHDIYGQKKVLNEQLITL